MLTESRLRIAHMLDLNAIRGPSTFTQIFLLVVVGIDNIMVVVINFK